MKTKTKIRLVCPIGTDLEMQLQWFRGKLKPWAMRQTIGYWAEHPEHWWGVFNTIAYLTRAVILEKQLKKLEKLRA